MNYLNIKYDDRYTDSINESKYIQSTNNTIETKDDSTKDDSVKSYKTLEELFIYTFDYNTLLIDNTNLFIDQQKLKYATQLDENKKLYNSLKYHKSFSKNLIQQGLQKSDTLSSILFLCDLNRHSIILFDKYNDKYYNFGSKYKDVLLVEYYNKLFRIINILNDVGDNIDSSKYSTNIGGLENIFDCNIKSLDIYEKYLKAISNYKLDDLIKIAIENKIDTKQNGKNKKKKDLYDEINIIVVVV